MITDTYVDPTPSSLHAAQDSFHFFPINVLHICKTLSQVKEVFCSFKTVHVNWILKTLIAINGGPAAAAGCWIVVLFAKWEILLIIMV